MRNLIVPITIFALCLYSCSNNKTYTYVEVVEKETVLGGTETVEGRPKEIKASSDSAAYLEAYETFCISQKVSKDMLASLGKIYSSPLKFRLYNDKGVDITNAIVFEGKEVREKEVAERIFSLRNSLTTAAQTSKNETTQGAEPAIKIDSGKVIALSKYFRKKKDEFSSVDRVWYEPKSAPQYTNSNGLYCYFMTEGGSPGPLRFRLQYYADEWLFFDKVQFAIDGKAYEYVPRKTETDNGDGGYIWEWFDDPLYGTERELIYALANAKSAKMKLIGRQYYDVKSITPQQINSIKQTLELFEAFGGKL